MLKGQEMKKWLMGEQKWYETKGRERKFSRCLNFDKEGKEADLFQKQWKDWLLE
jgi:hypothetical protein